MLEQVPEWLLCGGVVAVVLAAVHAGCGIARRAMAERAKAATGAEGVGGVVGAMLGLLAFMLAFAFGLAADRRDSRKALLLDEVNSIGTTYLRTDLLPEPQRDASRKLLRRYIDLRLDAVERPEHMAADIAETGDLQQALWRQAASLRDADLKNPHVAALYIDALNETIDLHTSRLTVSGYRIPTIVWAVFGVLLVLSALGVGYNFGLHGTTPHLVLTTMLAVSLAAVMFLIFDLDRGGAGWLKIDHEPMYELRLQMGAD